MAYGNTDTWSLVKRCGVDGEQLLFTVSFTTANTSAPTVNAATKGVRSVVRSDVGIFTITLPFTCKNVVATYSRSPTSAQEVHVTTTSTTVVVTVATAGGSTAADTTGLTINLIIVAEISGT